MPSHKGSIYFLVISGENRSIIKKRKITDAFTFEKINRSEKQTQPISFVYRTVYDGIEPTGDASPAF